MTSAIRFTTMRDAFSDATARLLDDDPRAALVLADIGVGRFGEAERRHRERVINVGIREQLMIGVAAGMALEGFRPIVHSYTPFLIERPFEQIKIDVSHQGVALTLVSIGASYDAASAGRTHQAPGDVALIATLPGWRIDVPGHPDEVEPLLRRAVAAGEPVYLRLSDEVNDAPHAEPSGDLVTLRRGSRDDATVVAVGPALQPTLEATRDLDVTVLYTATARPFDRAGLRAAVAAPEVVLVEPTLEGTSSAEVSAALIDVPHRLLALGVPAVEHRHYGDGAEHRVAHGLDAGGIQRRVAAFLGD